MSKHLGKAPPKKTSKEQPETTKKQKLAKKVDIVVSDDELSRVSGGVILSPLHTR